MFIDVREIYRGKRPKMRLTSVQMTEEEWEWLSKHCVDHKLTKSHIVRELIRQYRRQVESGQ